MKLIKLGGSVITDKENYRTPRKDVITRLCSEIARAGEPVTIVCGAGSYGHLKADEFKLQDGRDESIEGQVEAVALVQKDVRELNMMVLEALLAEGLNPVSLPPSSVCINANGKLYQLRTEIFNWFVDLGCTPVTFGDVVLDTEKGFSICSGDWLLFRLAGDMQVKEAIFVADTDGVFSADPKSDDSAKLLEEIRTGEDGSIDFKGQGKPDVTGGMGGKVRVALEMTLLGVTTHILNGTVENRLYDALKGKEVVSTVVRGE